MTENGDRPKYETFSVGLPGEVQEMRRRVSDRIARVAFGKKDRKGIKTYVLWEYILAQLDLMTDEDVKRHFGHGGH